MFSKEKHQKIQNKIKTRHIYITHTRDILIRTHQDIFPLFPYKTNIIQICGDRIVY